MSVKKEIYFLDIENATKNEPTKFFEKKAKQLLIAAGGYQPKPLYKIMIGKIYSETYDGLIFVKAISIPNYKLD
jgi:erythromycin esterase